MKKILVRIFCIAVCCLFMPYSDASEATADSATMWIELDTVTVTDRPDDWIKSLKLITKKMSKCENITKTEMFYYGKGQSWSVTYSNERAVQVKRTSCVFGTSQHKSLPNHPLEGSWLIEMIPVWHISSFLWDANGKGVQTSHRKVWTYNKGETEVENFRRNFHQTDFNKENVINTSASLPVIQAWFRSLSVNAPCFVDARCFRFALQQTDGHYATIAFETCPRQYEKRVFVLLKGSMVIDLQQDILCSMQIDKINDLRDYNQGVLWPEYRSFRLSTTEEHATMTFHPSGIVKTMEYVTEWIRPYDKENGVHGHYPPVQNPAENHCVEKNWWQCDTVYTISTKEIDKLPKQKKIPTYLFSRINDTFFCDYPDTADFNKAEQLVGSYMPIAEQYANATNESRFALGSLYRIPRLQKLLYWLTRRESGEYSMLN